MFCVDASPPASRLVENSLRPRPVRHGVVCASDRIITQERSDNMEALTTISVKHRVMKIAELENTWNDVLRKSRVRHNAN